MMHEHPWLIPAVFIGGYLLVGLLLERLTILLLTHINKHLSLKFEALIVASLKGRLFLLYTIIGAQLSVPLVITTETAVHSVRTLLLVLIILLATLLSADLLSGMMTNYTRRIQGMLRKTSILTNITRSAVFLIGALIVLQALGISITPILTTLGIGGLAVALALQDTLSNLFSGLQLIASRQLRPGDYVQLSTGEEGYIDDITWRNTSLRTLPNTIIIIPNAKVATSIVTNHNLPDREIAVLIEVGVAYGSDLDKVEAVTCAVAYDVMRDVEGGVPSFKPFIRFHTFGEHSVQFTVILRAREFVNKYLLKHEFIKSLYARYRQEGIQIPFPTRTIKLEHPAG